MKKFLIFILIAIIIISISTFVYKHFIKTNTVNRQNEENIQVGTPVPNIPREYFLLYIDNVLEDDSNLKINGKVSKGNISINNEISIVGLGKKGITTTVEKIQINEQETNYANIGDNVTLTLSSNIPQNYISPGQAVIILGTTKPVYNINAKLTSVDLDNIFEIQDKSKIFNINYDIDCTVTVLSSENNEIKIKLDVPIVIDNDIEFILKDSNNKTIATGITLNN